jgi:4-hydroxy-4-methyl-2-oxoglutarate aldolase
MPLAEKDRQQFETLLSGHVSDAMELLELPRAAIVGYTLIGAPSSVVVGPAFTVRQIPKHGAHAKEEPMVRHKEVSGGLAGSGDVVVIDVGGRTDVCSWGEFHSFSCLTRAVAGALIHGATRDSNAIREIGFPVFCKGFSPIKSRWNLETAAVNEPVSIGNVQVRPGDIIFADETGILVIPFEETRSVLAKAMEIRDWEVDEMARLRKERER